MGPMLCTTVRCEGSKVGDMTFRKGDQMELVNDSDPCWWVAWNQNSGITGRIHRDFVASWFSFKSKERFCDKISQSTVSVEEKEKIVERKVVQKEGGKDEAGNLAHCVSLIKADMSQLNTKLGLNKIN